MKIIWTDGAMEDLTGIVEYIRRDSLDASSRVAEVIFHRSMSLSDMPGRGRHHKSDDAWEIGVLHWPYILIYEIDKDAVTIHGICHASQERTR